MCKFWCFYCKHCLYFYAFKICIIIKIPVNTFLTCGINSLPGMYVSQWRPSTFVAEVIWRWQQRHCDVFLFHPKPDRNLVSAKHPIRHSVLPGYRSSSSAHDVLGLPSTLRARLSVEIPENAAATEIRKKK